MAANMIIDLRLAIMAFACVSPLCVSEKRNANDVCQDGMKRDRIL
jgi:hypothetical protein